VTGDPPWIDFLAGDFYVDGAREAYRWLPDHAPVTYAPSAPVGGWRSGG